MSFLQSLMSRSLRPGAASNLRASFGILRQHPLKPSAKDMPPNFYTSSMHRRPGIGHRSYTSNSYERNSSINSYILYGILGTNCAVFAYAKYVEGQAREGFPQNFFSFHRNFTLNYDDAVRNGQWWTTITSVFTHTQPMHLLGNMLSAYYFGLLVANAPGIKPLYFATLILGSGLSGSLFYLALRRQKLQEAAKANGGMVPPDMTRGLGFSGALMGVGAAAAFMYPRTTFMIYGIVPMPLWALITGYAVYDGYFLNSDNSRIAHAGHLGGLAFGVVYYFAKFRGLNIPPHPLM